MSSNDAFAHTLCSCVFLDCLKQIKTSYRIITESTGYIIAINKKHKMRRYRTGICENISVIIATEPDFAFFQMFEFFDWFDGL